MKFYKVVTRPSLLCSSETWVTMKRDTTRVEAAEKRFLRSVTGYTRLDKIRSKVIRKELDQPPWKNGQHQTPKTPSNTNLKEEEIVDAPGNNGNASMPEKVKRPNPCRKMMMTWQDSFFKYFLQCNTKVYTVTTY